MARKGKFGLGLVAAALLGLSLWPKKAKAAEAPGGGSVDTKPGEGGLIQPSKEYDPPPPASAGLQAWLAWAKPIADRFLPSFTALYSADRMKGLCVNAAEALGLGKYGAEAIWGLLASETGGGFVRGLRSDLSGTEVGVTQITRKRFDESEKPSTSAIWWEHIDLLNPKLAIWTTAEALARMDYRWGWGPNWQEKVGSWWASPAAYGRGQISEKAQRKARAIKNLGPNVWKYDQSAMHPGDGARPVQSMVLS